MASRVIKREPEDAKSVHHICRLCLSEESLEDVFSEDREEGGLHQWIQQYLSITISAADNWSHAICSICRIQLAEFHQFRLRSQEVQDILQSMIRTSTVGETEDTVVKLEYTEQYQEGDSDVGPYDDEIPDDEPPIGIKDMFVIEEVKIETHKDDDESQITLNQPEDDLGITDGVDSNGRKEESDATQHQCDVCFKVLASREKFMFHKRIHNKTLPCSICGKPLPSRWEVRRHERTHLSIEDRQREDKPFKCTPCQKSFMYRSEFTSHRKTVHQLRTHECHVCGYKFARRHSLTNHLQLHSKYGDDKQLSSLQPTKPQNDLNNKSENASAETNAPLKEKTKECDKCGKVFGTVKNLWRHFNYSHMKKFKCLKCDAGFRTKKLLEKHKKFHAWKEALNTTVKTKQQLTPGKEQHQCDVCFRIYPNKTKLFAHKYCHRQEVSCSVCGKPFANKSRVDIHMRSHLSIEERCAEQKPFQCEQCSKAFRQRNELNAHARTVHGPKTHECHICGIKFTRRSNLNSHMRRHIVWDDSRRNE